MSEAKQMTKQEEIREVVRRAILRTCDAEDCGNTLCDKTCPYLNKLTDGLIWELHSQGCVVKVERELPPGYIVNIILAGKQALDKIGYCATEPLIEGVK